MSSNRHERLRQIISQADEGITACDNALAKLEKLRKEVEARIGLMDIHDQKAGYRVLARFEKLRKEAEARIGLYDQEADV